MRIPYTLPNVSPIFVGLLRRNVEPETNESWCARLPLSVRPSVVLLVTRVGGALL